MFTRRPTVGVAITAMLFAAGCGGDAIRTYEVPAPAGVTADAEAPAQPPTATPTGEPTHRMLAAIVRGPERAWFFKLVGSAEQIESVAEPVNELFATIGFDEGSREPRWQTPAGWTNRGKSGMRHATLVMDAEGSPDGPPLELSVTALASSPDWRGLILGNLNRWRGQMQLPPIDAANLDEQTRALSGAPEGSVAIDISGWFTAGRMTPPFAGRAAPPAANPRPTPPRSSGRPTLFFDKPEEWVEQPPTAMRLANLRTSADDDAAVITASVFPNTGAMGDALTNVNRWRRQAGLPPVDQPTLDEESESVTIGGVAGQSFAMIGEQRSIVAAMATRDAQVWFFKLDGAPAIVEPQRDAFAAWLASVRFDAEAEEAEAGEPSEPDAASEANTPAATGSSPPASDGDAD